MFTGLPILSYDYLNCLLGNVPDAIEVGKMYNKYRGTKCTVDTFIESLRKLSVTVLLDYRLLDGGHTTIEKTIPVLTDMSLDNIQEALDTGNADISDVIEGLALQLRYTVDDVLNYRRAVVRLNLIYEGVVVRASRHHVNDGMRHKYRRTDHETPESLLFLGTIRRCTAPEMLITKVSDVIPTIRRVQRILHVAASMNEVLTQVDQTITFDATASYSGKREEVTDFLYRNQRQSLKVLEGARVEDWDGDKITYLIAAHVVMAAELHEYIFTKFTLIFYAGTRRLAKVVFRRYDDALDRGSRFERSINELVYGLSLQENISPGVMAYIERRRSELIGG